MNQDQAKKLVETLSDYYGKSLKNPIVAAVWAELFLPLTLEEGTEVVMHCIENHQFLPTPKVLKEEFALKKGVDFKAELSAAIAAYCRNNAREIRKIPAAVSSAIVKAGGANKFKNATEQQWGKMERDYLAFRTQAEQQKRMSLLASTNLKSIGGSHESN